MLAGGYRAQMIEVVALNSADEGDAQAAGQERVFAVSFLAAAPARVAKDVDVGRPEGEPVEDAVVALSLRLVVLGAGFLRDDVAHALHDGAVPGGRHADGLRKHGGIPGPRHAVESLVPCLVIGHAETGNGGGPVFKLRRLLFESHLAHEGVGAFARGEIRIQPCGLLGPHQER